MRTIAGIVGSPAAGSTAKASSVTVSPWLAATRLPQTVVTDWSRATSSASALAQAIWVTAVGGWRLGGEVTQASQGGPAPGASGVARVITPSHSSVAQGPCEAPWSSNCTTWRSGACPGPTVVSISSSWLGWKS